jgi:predicted AAA+ superfamily ATPase
MINKDILRRIVEKQKQTLSNAEEDIERDILPEILKLFNDNRVIILSGIRRAGKSTLLKQIMRNNLDYCYVNFEEEGFIDFNAQDFEMLNEVLIEVYGNPKIYFFDEVQNIEKFETFVRRLQDEGKKIVITGSNATLLSKELGTKLTGRYKLFELYPFSFKEYIKFKKVVLEKNSFYISEKKVELIKLFGDYLLNGGFPEYLKNKDPEYIKTIYENILYRDIISRYAIKKQKVLKELVNLLATNISSTFTYNALKKSVGVANSITIKEYISYLVNSYLLFELQKFDFSVRRQLNFPKKIYFVDPVLNYFIGFNFSENKGKILENMVFIELKRNKNELFYHSEKNECDFVIKEGTKITKVIQVCYDLNKENKDREVNGLIEAMEKFKLKEGLILTFEQDDELKINNKKIKVIPVWKWLLEN